MIRRAMRWKEKASRQGRLFPVSTGAGACHAAIAESRAPRMPGRSLLPHMPGAEKGCHCRQEARIHLRTELSANYLTLSDSSFEGRKAAMRRAGTTIVLLRVMSRAVF